MLRWSLQINGVFIRDQLLCEARGRQEGEEDRMGRGEKSNNAGPTKPLPTLGGSEGYTDPQGLPHGICCHAGLWAESLPRDRPPFIDVIPRQEIIIKTVVNMFYVPGMVLSMS